jgi:outer membrane lipoprotein-sorting protein
MKGVMKTRTLLLSVLVGAVALSPALAQAPRTAQAAAATAAVQITGAERAAALAAAGASLNRQLTMQGRFIQTAPDGQVTQGSFYLQKPGKVRFDYDPPSPLLIVADGATVAVEDRRLKDVTRVPLRSTPLFYVLKRDVNLERDAKTTKVARAGDALLITARDKTGQAEGEITMTFAANTYELRSWEILDGQRQTTRITLAHVRAASRLDPKLFRVKDAKDPTARRKG